MNRVLSIAILTISLVVFSLLGCTMALAQEPPPQPPPPDNKNQTVPDQANSANSGDDAGSLEHPVAVTTTTPPIQQTASAGFLMPSISPLRWGPVYVGFAQFAETFDQGTAFNGAGNLNVAASQFSAGLVFDKQFRKARVAVQYTPQITILNGEVFSNFANQNTGVDLAFLLTSRLSLDLSNRFIYYRSNDNLIDIFLSIDSTSGLTLQKDFIRVEGTWLSDATTASFTYALSGRTRIKVAPYYVYATSSGQGAGVVPTSVDEYSINVGVAHDLTARSSVSASYLEQTDVYSGPSSNTMDFQTFQGGYSRTLKGGLTFSGALGFTTFTSQNSRTWSQLGSLSVVKGFRRSLVGLTYSRGHTFAGYISSQLTDRIDATYQQNFGRRVAFGGGVGYHRDTATAGGIWGKYGEGHVSFGLSSSVSLFGSYVYQWQNGNNLVGSTNYVRCGVQWMPPFRR